MEKESDVKLVILYCWHCGKKFYAEFNNVYAGQIFCSDKCRENNLKNEIKMEKDKVEIIKHKSLLNNCTDDDEAILHKGELKKLRKED